MLVGTNLTVTVSGRAPGCGPCQRLGNAARGRGPTRTWSTGPGGTVGRASVLNHEQEGPRFFNHEQAGGWPGPACQAAQDGRRPLSQSVRDAACAIMMMIPSSKFIIQ